MATKGNPVVQVRVPVDARARWQAAADLAGVSLGEWMRHQCDKAVGMGGVPMVGRPAAGRGSRAKRPPRGVCARVAFHRSGAFCKTCGTTPS